jgi:Flp pilus assembly protein CpaB
MVEMGDADEELVAALLDQTAVSAAVADQWVAAQTITAGTALRESDFRPQVADSDLRAMSIEIDPGNAVNGEIGVKDRIDVIVVRKGVARYVVTDAEVIAISGVDSSISSNGFTVTVALDGPTSLRLASALNLGEIEIVRSTGASPANPEDLYNPNERIEDLADSPADVEPGEG